MVAVVKSVWKVAVIADNPTVVAVTTPGPQGPAAAGGALEGYVHTQATPQATWTINHNLGRRPNVELRTTGGVVMVGQVTHVNDNQVQVAFATALAGTARLI